MLMYAMGMEGSMHAVHAVHAVHAMHAMHASLHPPGRGNVRMGRVLFPSTKFYFYNKGGGGG